MTAGVRGGVGNGNRHAARPLLPPTPGGCNAPQVLPAVWRLDNARDHGHGTHRVELCRLWLGKLSGHAGLAANTIPSPQSSEDREAGRQGFRAPVTPHRWATRNAYRALQPQLAGQDRDLATSRIYEPGSYFQP